MKILAIGTSNSAHSINRMLATYVAGLVDGADVETIDINDYEMPLFSIEREQVLGQPAEAKAFLQKIADADGLVVSFAEHNGSYTAAYKNLFDWASRTGKDVYQHKPSLFLSTSPGQRGGASVLAAANGSAPFFGAEIVASVSVPSFQENFDSETQKIKNSEIQAQLEQAAALLKENVAEKTGKGVASDKKLSYTTA